MILSLYSSSYSSSNGGSFAGGAFGLGFWDRGLGLDEDDLG